MPTDPTPPLADDHEGQRRLAAAQAAQATHAADVAHWRHTSRLTLVLLALWLATGFGTVFFARELSQFTLFDWPLSFYMAAQGASLVSLAIIGFYAWRVRRLDRRHAGAVATSARHDGPGERP